MLTAKHATLRQFWALIFSSMVPWAKCDEFTSYFGLVYWKMVPAPFLGEKVIIYLYASSQKRVSFLLCVFSLFYCNTAVNRNAHYYNFTQSITCYNLCIIINMAQESWNIFDGRHLTPTFLVGRQSAHFLDLWDSCSQGMQIFDMVEVQTSAVRLNTTAGH